jgi:hypothetical protein
LCLALAKTHRLYDAACEATLLIDFQLSTKNMGYSKVTGQRIRGVTSRTRDQCKSGSVGPVALNRSASLRQDVRANLSLIEPSTIRSQFILSIALKLVHHLFSNARRI